MPKLTDYVRQGYRRRERPWDRTELPEWWNVAVWLGVGGICLMLVVSAVLARGDSSAGDAGAAPRQFPVETLNPRALESSPGDGAPTGAAAPTGRPPEKLTPESFTATNATRVTITGGGSTVVPAGARNVALAAARAAATGDWKGVPFIGAARPTPSRSPTPGGSVVGEITVADPRRTGNGQYQFSAKITHGGGADPYVVKFAVERDGSGYAIRAG